MGVFHPTEKQLQVLYVIDSLSTGGAEQSLLEIAPELRKRGIGIEVVYLSEREGLREQFEMAKIDARPLGGHKWRLSKVIRLARLIRRRRPDLIHTTLFEADVIGRVAALLAGVPVVTSVVNTSYDVAHFAEPNISRTRLRFARWADDRTLRLASGVHAISQTVANDLRQRVPASAAPPTVIYRGRRGDRFLKVTEHESLSLRAELGLSTDATVILAVARQEHQKGLDVLITAMRTVDDVMPSAVLLIAGRRGLASDDLTRLASGLGLEDRVRFLGHRADVAELLSVASVFAFPSRREGLGGALIEAMASGVPIVCSDLPVLREVVSDSAGCFALLVPSESPEVLARALVGVLSDQQMREDMSTRGLSRYASTFEIRLVAEQMEKFYRTSLRG